MTTTQLSPGIYHIVVAGGVDPTYLTRHGEGTVTILPPSVEHDPEQRWRVYHEKDGNIIIERPSKLIPGSYLTYKGAPLAKKPEKGDRIVYRLSEFPPNEWHLTTTPGFRSLIRVAGSELGIGLSRITIHPPALELVHEAQLQWVFERVSDE